MDAIQQELLEQVAGLHEVPEGAYNIRANGEMAGRNTTANIDIITKEDCPGIDIRIKPGTRSESVHIPVVLSQSGLQESVYNDFFVGEDCDITIIAGCGIHNGGAFRYPQVFCREKREGQICGKALRIGGRQRGTDYEPDHRDPSGRGRVSGDGDGADQGH